MRRGRSTFVKLGDKEVDYEPSFKLYLQTKLSNPHCAHRREAPRAHALNPRARTIETRPR